MKHNRIYHKNIIFKQVRIDCSTHDANNRTILCTSEIERSIIINLITYTFSQYNLSLKCYQQFSSKLFPHPHTVSVCNLLTTSRQLFRGFSHPVLSLDKTFVFFFFYTSCSNSTINRIVNAYRFEKREEDGRVTQCNIAMRSVIE